MSDLAQLREQATKKSPDLGMVSFPAPTVLELLDKIAELERQLADKERLEQERIWAMGEEAKQWQEYYDQKDAKIAVLAEALSYLATVRDDCLENGPSWAKAFWREYPSASTIISNALTPDVTEIVARYTSFQTTAQRAESALISLPCGNCHLYGSPAECPCACHMFPEEKASCLPARYRESLAVVERVRKAITAHTTIATRAPDSPSAHYILPNLKAALREQDDVGGPQ